MEVKTIREGGNNDRQIRLNGPVALRAADAEARHDRQLRPLGLVQRQRRPTRGLRADAEVVLFAADGTTERARFLLSRCVPVKLKAPALNAQGRADRDRGTAGRLRDADASDAGRQGACSESVRLAKAELIEARRRTSTTRSPAARTVEVQFNPETLKVTLRQPDRAARRAATRRGQRRPPVRRRRHHQARPAAVVRRRRAMDEETPVDDVRRLTQKVVFFMTPQKSEADPKKLVAARRPLPLGHRSCSTASSRRSRRSLEFFSPDGKPLRASITLTLSQQKILESEFEGDGQVPGRAGHKPPAMRRRRHAATTVQGMAGQTARRRLAGASPPPTASRTRCGSRPGSCRSTLGADVRDRRVGALRRRRVGRAGSTRRCAVSARPVRVELGGSATWPSSINEFEVVRRDRDARGAGSAATAASDRAGARAAGRRGSRCRDAARSAQRGLGALTALEPRPPGRPSSRSVSARARRSRSTGSATRRSTSGADGAATSSNRREAWRAASCTFGNWGGARQRRLPVLRPRHARLRQGDQGEARRRRCCSRAAITAIDARRFPKAGRRRSACCAEDRLQDLRMTRRTRTLRRRDADATCCGRIAGDHGLQPRDRRRAATTHKVLAQVNQSDLAFLRDRARREDAEVWVEGTKLHVAQRARRSAARSSCAWAGAAARVLRQRRSRAPAHQLVGVSGWDVAGKRAAKHEADEAAIRVRAQRRRRAASRSSQRAFGDARETLAHAVPATDARSARARRGELPPHARGASSSAAASPRREPELRVGAQAEAQGRRAAVQRQVHA